MNSSSPNKHQVDSVNTVLSLLKPLTDPAFKQLPAVEFNGISISYEELDVLSNQVAYHLVRSGAPKGSNIGLCVDRSLELPVLILGILKAGFAYVPFDPAYPAERIAYMLKQSGVTRIIVSDAHAHLFKSAPVSVMAIAGLLTEAQPVSLPGSTPEQTAYILFTSGSTGNPKGVVMPHSALSNLISWQQKVPGLTTAQRTLQFAPVSFDVSFQELFTTWSVGGTLVMIDDETRLNTIRLLEFIQSAKIERLFLPFIALQQLSDIAGTMSVYPHSLKQIVTAGEQLQITPQIRNLFEKIPGCQLHNHYGPTETHVVTAYTLPQNINAWNQLPPIGIPIDNVNIYLLDDQLKQVGKGQEGSLYVGGAAVAVGYVNAPELTGERFIPDPFSKAGFIYKTGDQARLNDDGQLEYIGRADDQVKVRGYRIELAEVEAAIAAYQGVSQCAVMVRTDRPGEKRLVAYVVTADHKESFMIGLRKHIAQKLPDYMHPAAIVRMDAIPKTPSGKTDRKALPPPGTSRPESAVPYKAPRNEKEKQIAAVWSELLLIDDIGVEDNFFEFGGNSLLAIQSVTLLRKRYGVDIPVVDLYRYPTIAGLNASLSPVTNEATALEKMRQRQFGAKGGAKSVEDGIAIIGMAGRFPGADTIPEFWNNLVENKETITRFTADILDPSLDPSVTNDPAYVKARGILKDASQFDAPFFNVNPKLAALTDPQQRIFMEVCWEAMEDAGYAGGYHGLTGAYAGMGNNTYYPHNVVFHKQEIERSGAFQVMVANEKDYIATRISHFMNLKGPGLSIHTACSTSLTAVALACRDLWDNRCDMAIAGGIAITCPVNSGHLYQDGGMFSSDGHTRAFDAAASGTVFSDGAGVVILKRYRDALRDGDTITAVIRGVGINNDGADKASFTAPSVEGQAGAIVMAHADAGVDPASIGYIETHGTATPLGDPIEITALKQAFGNTKDKAQYCKIGSVKTNIGHLTAAAGIAGLIKTALSLKNELLPASLHFNSPNPAIDFTQTPFEVNSVNSLWEKGDAPRRAGVSSFGVGGTNVHIVVEEAPAFAVSGPSRKVQLLLLSAKNEDRLKESARRLQQFLKHNQTTSLPDVAYTLATGRADFAARQFVVAASPSEAAGFIDTPVPGSGANRVLKSAASGVAFVFPGQGAQFVNMGRAFYEDEIVYKEAVNHCAELFKEYLDIDIRDLLYPDQHSTTASEQLQQTIYTQPALFTTGYALAKLWMHWGILPSVLAGHSIGEFAAACIAGIMKLEDAVMLVANRGKLMQALPSGSMVSVRMPVDALRKILPDNIAIAAVNGPELSVISGTHDAVKAFVITLEQKEIIHKKLMTSHAFHSPMMDPIIGTFKSLFKDVTIQQPAIPVVSTATGKLLSDEDAVNPEYWAQHIRQTVLFADAIKTIWQHDPGCFILELGPRNTVSTLARLQVTVPGQQHAYPVLGDKHEDDNAWRTACYAIGQLWLSGIKIDMSAFFGLENRVKMSLPTYPFENKSYWLAPPAFAPQGNQLSRASVVQDLPQNEIPSNTMNIPPRKDRIIAELKSVMEDASGIEMTTAPHDVSFPELGMDSLFLTQAALTISKKYNTKITFRQLNEEYGTLNTLAGFIDSKLPAETAQPASISVLPPEQAAITGITEAPQGTLEWLINQQMKMMQDQLNMIRGIQHSTPEVTHHATKTEVTENEKADTEKPFGAIARIEKTSDAALSVAQRAWLDNFIKEYTAKTRKSKQYTQQHRSHLADPRVVTGFKPLLKELIYQVVVDQSSGCRLTDIDGNQYIDVLNGFGSNFLGYGAEIIKQAVLQQMNSGIELGPQHPLAGEVAELICEFTGYDRAGFCNTGSEAVLGAMRIARTVTGRNLIVCFNGSYHGINDEVIVRGSKKLKSFPAAAGIMPEAVENMLVLDYGTEEALDIIRSRAGELAAVMVEPIQSRRADFRPAEFIQQVREITQSNGCLLIFDEVITGFRLEPGGAQTFYNVKADLGTYGKVIGGGMPIGVIAGRREFMDALDGGHWKFGDDSVPETGVTYFAGTFVRHPLALAAAKAVLLHLKSRGREIYDKLNGMTGRLVDEVNQYCIKTGAPFHLVSFGSLFKIKWDTEQSLGELLFILLRNKGIHIYDGFPCFLTDAFTEKDVNEVIDAFKGTIAELQKVGFLTAGTVHEINNNGKAVFDPAHPPQSNARIGKDAHGNQAWFIPDPDRPGKFKILG